MIANKVEQCMIDNKIEDIRLELGTLIQYVADELNYAVDEVNTEPVPNMKNICESILEAKKGIEKLLPELERISLKIDRHIKENK